MNEISGRKGKETLCWRLELELCSGERVRFSVQARLTVVGDVRVLELYMPCGESYAGGEGAKRVRESAAPLGKAVSGLQKRNSQV